MTSQLRHGLLALVAALFVGAAGSAEAQNYRYTLQSPGPLSSVANAQATPCDIAPCVIFTGAEVLSGSFVTAGSLAANMSGGTDTPLVSFSFTDGVRTFNSSDPNVRLTHSNLVTNGLGQITAFNIEIQRWNALPSATGDNANGRFAVLNLGASNGQVNANVYCSFIGTAVTDVSNACLNGVFGTDTTSAARNDTFAFSGEAIPVPTLSEWAMILFGLMLAGGAALMIQRRRIAA